MSVAARFDSNVRAPSIVIEDPARKDAYYIPAGEIDAFKADARVWAKVDANTVTFNIPGGDLSDAVQPFPQKPDANPSVLIRFSAARTAYFLTHDQLQIFKIEPPARAHDEAVRFIIPRGE